jgi:hypothetical protein
MPEVVQPRASIGAGPHLEPARILGHYEARMYFVREQELLPANAFLLDGCSYVGNSINFFDKLHY